MDGTKQKINDKIASLSQKTSECLLQGNEIYVHTNTYTRIFIAVLFRITKDQKEPLYNAMDKQINKLLTIQTMKYSSTIKRKEQLR